MRPGRGVRVTSESLELGEQGPGWGDTCMGGLGRQQTRGGGPEAVWGGVAWGLGVLVGAEGRE